MMQGDSSLLVSLLNECEPGALPPDVFEAVARVAVYPAVEFIPLRKVEDRIEVLLFERPVDDHVWPSKLHTPGTILRPTDITYQDAFNRLYEDELMMVETLKPIFLGAELSHNHRGRCMLLEHLVIVTGTPRLGRFYDIDHLPSEFIQEQYPSLLRAVAAYRKMEYL
jgi:hypothetical protein